MLTAARPWEGCALLLGRQGLCPHLQQVWPCLNNWPELAERPRRFALDPREQLLAQRWARSRGLAVLGSAHSHPSSDPTPSALDLALTVAPALVVIAGVGADHRGASPWQWGFWWLAESQALGSAPEPLPLPWTMAD
ncbi:MAG: M67 family metallopeptidase [Cyanobacteriota bacterium]|nr:M67 family metallopeptidase [Cyanobacteriota bacterium]